MKINRSTREQGRLLIIAGPCAVESEKQIVSLAEQLKDAGADYLRGGAFKPRTSPYDFQGLAAEGIRYLERAKKETGLRVVSEIVDIRDIDLFENIDVLQVGARNMQNFELLKELGKAGKPVLLKRGFAATYRELLASAEYIVSEGNPNVVLCERGIRTFEQHTRNTLDLAAVPVLKSMSDYPICVDPSHGTGRCELVEPMALAAVSAGADALMIEVHSDPETAALDGMQSITPEEFRRLARMARNLKAFLTQDK